MTYRVGIGYDIHRLEAGQGLAIAGVHVDCPYRAVAHSDGDVVLHALCDALLGAVAAGDLGEHFPDTDPEHAGRDSAEFVAEVMALDALRDWRIANLDVNVIAQVPRLGPHKGAMRIRLAELFGVALDRIGLKARTKEGLDAVGEKRAIAAQAVVLLERRKRPVSTTALMRHRRIGASTTPKTGRQVKHRRAGDRLRER
jgi:2-C-methyl-D-erythritol 2,4-cyclodiphosphate synthase